MEKVLTEQEEYLVIIIHNKALLVVEERMREFITVVNTEEEGLPGLGHQTIGTLVTNQVKGY